MGREIILRLRRRHQLRCPVNPDAHMARLPFTLCDTSKRQGMVSARPLSACQELHAVRRNAHSNSHDGGHRQKPNTNHTRQPLSERLLRLGGPVVELATLPQICDNGSDTARSNVGTRMSTKDIPALTQFSKQLQEEEVRCRYDKMAFLRSQMSVTTSLPHVSNFCITWSERLSLCCSIFNSDHASHGLG